MSDDTVGPFIVWEFYSYEGWHPKSYPTLREAVLAHRYREEFCVTKLVKFDVSELDSDGAKAETP
jgi:hypothetical protein